MQSLIIASLGGGLNCNSVSSILLNQLDDPVNWNNKNIVSFTQNDLKSLVFVTAFNMQNNKITSLVMNQFHEVRTGSAKTVNLSSNLITNIASRAFFGQAFREINLSNNQIQSLGTPSFENAERLSHLDLSNNQITDFNVTSINQNPSNLLVELRLILDGNPLTLKSNNFDGLTLEYLYLQNANITTIPTDAFKTITDVERIYLANNKISTLQSNAFSAAPGLDFLYLNNNELTSIPADSFGSIPSLTRIYLGVNQISEIQPNVWDGLPNLAILSINDNNLTSVPVDILNADNNVLADFRLNSNAINSIPDAAFSDYSVLTQLTLASNALTTIQPTAFDGLAATTIDLSDNQISSLPMNLLLQHIDPSSITTFDLSNNPIASSSWEITDVQWVVNTDGSYMLQLDHSLPEAVDISVSSPTGSLNVSTLTIAAGSTTSSALTWTASEAGNVIILDGVDSQINVDILGGHLIIPQYKSNGICDRSEKIKALLFIAVSLSECEDVMQDDLLGLLGTVDWSSQTIATLTAIDLTGLPNVDLWDLSSNQITELVTATFNGSSFKDIDLSNNQIDTLAEQTVKAGINLRLFDLSNNLISDFNASSINQNLGQANSQLNLVLNDNPLTLKPNNFAGLILAELHLQNLNITTVSSDVFATVNNIKRLDLGNNNMTALTNLTFGTIPGLIRLDLNSNQITSLTNDAFSALPSLSTVDLGDNNLSAIPVNTFAAQTNLEMLSIDNNNLAAFPVDIIASANNVVVNLHLQNNVINILPDAAFTDYSNLVALDLSSNALTALQPEHFVNATATSMDFSNNQILSLPLNLLSNHTAPATITSFDVSGNQLTNNSWEITNVSWVENLNGGFMLQVGHGFSADVTVDISSSTGTLNVSSVTIPQGSTSSTTVSWTPLTPNSVLQLAAVTPQVAIANLGGHINIPTEQYNGICDRSSAIQTILLNALSEQDCQVVTLANVLTLNNGLTLSNQSIDVLTDIDLVGLANINDLDFAHNNLTSLADNILLTTNPSTVSMASNNISVIQTNALVTSTSPDNNVDYDLSNNAITSTTLSSGFLTPLKSIDFPNKSIDLSYNNITTLDNSQLDIRSDNLNLSHNQITNLPATVFSNMRQAGHDMVIDLSYNQLTSIAAETILGETFAQVDLSYNQIDALATDAVIYGEDLTLLDLGYNLISDFNASSVHQNPNSLNVQLDLVLDGNPLVLKANNFAGLELNYLYLQNSNLTTIPADTFAGATNINRIFLTGTNLTALETGSFSSVAGLDFLFLNNNQISNIPVDAFGTISSLTRIYLGDNNLTAVPENAFSNLLNLQTLSLNSNQLTAVPVNILGNNASLTTFRLQDNNIANLSGISFSEYTALTELNLGTNQISTLTADNFQGMTATRIYLPSNQLTSLPINLLSGHSNPASITNFDVSGNALINNSWEITNVSWVEHSNGGFSLQIGHALAQDFAVNITSTSGTLDVETLTISSGNTSSNAVNWTPLNTNSVIQLAAVTPQVAIASFGGHINIPTVQYNGICDRSNAIQTLILNILNIATCQQVTLTDLSGVTGDLDWSNQSINQLTDIDLVGFLDVYSLDVSANNLSILQDDILLDLDLDVFSVANNNISVIAANALVTSSSPDNNMTYDLSNNAITSTTLSSGFLTALKSGGFPNKSIDLSYNNITTLDNTQLDIRSDNLNLSHNQITNLPATVFNNMRQSFHDMVIDLSYNQLTSIAADTILGETFAQVDLSYNQIDTLATNFVSYGEDLTRLDLGYNLISDFNASSVHQNPVNLNVRLDLVLDGNPLVLKANNFAGLDLKYLYVQNANLTTIPADTFADATYINRIYLASNQITDVPAGAFSSAPGLDFLFLNANAITNISADAFGDVPLMRALYLGSNNLSEIAPNTFATLTNLRTLSIDSNDLNAVPVNMFNSSANALTTLRLHSNNISNIPNAAFSDYSALVNLNLADNAMTTLDPLALQGLMATDIDLSNNLITALPINLLSEHNNPASITRFDVSGNALTNNSWEITNVSWIENINGSFALQIGHALPVDVTIDISSISGTLNVASLTLSAGSTSSQSVTWSPQTDSSIVHIQPANDQIAIAQLGGHIVLPTYEANGICDRSSAIQTILLNALSEQDCTLVTIASLLTLNNGITFSNQSIDVLTDIDLVGLANINDLDFAHNNLTSLADNILLTTNISTISLANNNISVIAANALVTSTSPDNNVDYNLSNNAITSTTLSSGFLNGLKSQNFPNKSIDLSFNNITTLERASFDIFTTNLNLSNNQIVDFAVDALYDLRLAGIDMVLDLSYNQLSNIAARSLFGESLGQVNLSNNQIHTLAPEAIYSGVDLSSLDLGYNQISDFNASSIHQNNNPNVQLDLVLDGNPLVLKANNFAGLDLDNVYLQHANITTIPADTFATATKINRLFLSRNNITTLEAGAFSSASGLEWLFLDSNEITDFAANAFGTISSLQRIYLGGNNLTAVQPNTFSGATSLQYLSLNDNQLIEVPVNMLGNNGSLTHFRLQNNNIANLSGISFSEYTSLAELNLGGNQIPTLTADNFKGMTATRIYLSDNQISSLPLNLLLEHNNPATITAFDFSGNSIGNNGWEITNVSWVEGSSNVFTLQLNHALPVDVTVNITSVTGSLDVSALTITKGSTSSAEVTWTAASVDDQVQIIPATNQIDIAPLSGHIVIPSMGFLGICDRSMAIQAFLLNALSEQDCKLVTLIDLASLSGMVDFSNQGIDELNDVDLDHLVSVSDLNFSDNTLNSLVNNILSDINPASFSVANNAIDTIQADALLTSSSPDNNVAYNLSNNVISSQTLASGFLNSLKSATHAGKSFDLSHNNITDLDRAYFDVYATNLNLSNNQISSLGAEVFADMRLTGAQQETATTFALSHNQLTHIAAETFLGSSIRQVDLSNNQIIALATDSLLSVTNLAKLNLAHNLITDFNASIIGQSAANAGFTLILDSNPLNLTANNFAGLNLTDLYLQNANLTTIPADTFAGATNINQLFLANSNITTLESGSFSSAPGLDVLYLNNNEITIIPVDAFGAIPTLTEIYLADNQLIDVPADALVGLTNLQVLDLHNNNITDLTNVSFSDYKALEELNLNGNELATLQMANLQGLSAMKIDFSGNQIASLPMNLLAQHNDPASITSFDISGNSLANDSWEITNVSWVEMSNQSYTLQLGHSLPTDVIVNVTSLTGSLNVSELIIPAGSTSSPAVQWTPASAASVIDIQVHTNQYDIAPLQGYINIAAVQYGGICNRTQQVQALLLSAVNQQDCLTVLPIELKGLSGDLAWQNQNLSTLSIVDLEDLSAIAHFQLDNNSLVALQDNIFNTTAPDFISLTSNNISSIAANALHTSINGANNLSINLSNNAITAGTLATGFLTASDTGKFVGGSFDLSFNQIQSIAVASFADFNPAQLYLNDNSITDLADGALTAATALEQLDLANNQLSTITADSFSNLQNLLTLDLSNNTITNLAAASFADLTALQTLNLADNQLGDLTADLFTGLSVTNIDVRNNSIVSLPVDLLKNHANPANITAFRTSGNDFDNWLITQAQFVKLDAANAQLIIGHALPQDITVSLSSTTGTLNPTAVTIAKGQTSSQTVTWTGTTNSSAEIIPDNDQVDISILSGYVSIARLIDVPVFNTVISNQTLVAEHSFAPIQLPLASGDGNLTYTLQEMNQDGLPGDLVFNATNRQLSGRIDTVGEYTLRYLAQDSEGDSVSMVFELLVIANFRPAFSTDNNLTYSVIQGEQAAIILPAATAGNGNVVYTFTPVNATQSLPEGLLFNASQRSITGIFSAGAGDFEFIYQAADNHDGDSDSLNITLRLQAQNKPEFDETQMFESKTMRQDDTAFALALPTVQGGNDELIYSFTTNNSAGLPAGLQFNMTSGMIEGQPTVFGQFNITVTVDDSDQSDINDNDTFSFVLVLLESLGFAEDLPENYIAISSAPEVFVLPTGKGGVPSYSIGLLGTLPPGFSFDIPTRTISGASAVSGTYNLTYQVTDSQNYSYQQPLVLVISVVGPQFVLLLDNIDLQLGQSIDFSMPAVTTHDQIAVTYSVSGLPAGVYFDPSTRKLSGGALQLGTHTVTYKAVDDVNQEVEQTFTITVTPHTALLSDIMWRQALSIADHTVNAVKKRFTLIDRHRLPYVQDVGFQGANLQVSDANWIGIWINSDSATAANSDRDQNQNDYSWDGNRETTQIGIDFSGNGYLIGLINENIATSSTFSVGTDTMDYSGNFDITGLDITTLYGGYYHSKYNVWAVTSIGGGAADLATSALNLNSSIASEVDYSMLAFGGEYKLGEVLDVGFEGIVSASLDFTNPELSTVPSNVASRNKFFGSIDFSKWTNGSARKKVNAGGNERTIQNSLTKPSFKFTPKFALALRSDSSAASSSTGLESTVSLAVDVKWFNLEFGTRNFSAGDFSESNQWFSFHLQPVGNTGLNIEHSQQIGDEASISNELMSDRALTDIVAGMRQDDTVSSVSTISYGWNISTGTLQLFSEGKSSYADSTPANLFHTKSDIRWEHIGLSFDSANRTFNWNAQANSTAISFKATVRY